VDALPKRSWFIEWHYVVMTIMSAQQYMNARTRIQSNDSSLA
jgi:hypothetical protein